MNIVQLQEQLKNFSQDQLVKEMQMPSGTAPQFLVLGEIMRRQKMQQDFAAQQAKGAPQSTVAEDAIAAAGVPQGGIAGMARALAPQTNMTQNTGVQAMAYGGSVKKMNKGGAAMTDPAIRAMANRLGMSVSEYLRSVGEEQATRLEESAARRALRDRMVDMEPVGEGVTIPTQADLDRAYNEDRFGFAASRPLVAPVVEDSAFTPPAMEARVMGRDMAAPGLPALAAAVEPPPAPASTPRRVVAPQYEGDTVFDPVLGVPITGGGVQGEVAGPTTGSFIQDLILSDEAKRQVADINAKVAAAKGETEREAAAAGAPELQNPAFRAAMDERATPEAEAAQDRETERAAEQPTPPEGGGGAGGIASAGGMSSFEQELMDMLGRREKAAEQDKWLALAQVGLNMMSSTQPTLLGAIGEAGVKGVEAARAARDQYDKDRLDLLGTIEQSRQARAAAATAAARRGQSGGISPLQAAKLELDMAKYGLDVAEANRAALADDMDLLYRLAPDGATPLSPANAGIVDQLRTSIQSRLTGGGAVDPYAGRDYTIGTAQQ